MAWRHGGARRLQRGRRRRRPAQSSARVRKRSESAKNNGIAEADICAHMQARKRSAAHRSSISSAAGPNTALGSCSACMAACGSCSGGGWCGKCGSEWLSRRPKPQPCCCAAAAACSARRHAMKLPCSSVSAQGGAKSAGKRRASVSASAHHFRATAGGARSRACGMCVGRASSACARGWRRLRARRVGGVRPRAAPRRAA